MISCQKFPDHHVVCMRNHISMASGNRLSGTTGKPLSVEYNTIPVPSFCWIKKPIHTCRVLTYLYMIQKAILQKYTFWHVYSYFIFVYWWETKRNSNKRTKRYINNNKWRIFLSKFFFPLAQLKYFLQVWLPWEFPKQSEETIHRHSYLMRLMTLWFKCLSFMFNV